MGTNNYIILHKQREKNYEGILVDIYFDYS